MSERLKALELLEQLTDFDTHGVSHEEILEYLIKNFLSGDKALECMEAAKEELAIFIDEEEEEEAEEDECPNCMSTDISDWDFDYDTGTKIYKCADCGDEF